MHVCSVPQGLTPQSQKVFNTWSQCGVHLSLFHTGKVRPELCIFCCGSLFFKPINTTFRRNCLYFQINVAYYTVWEIISVLCETSQLQIASSKWGILCWWFLFETLKCQWSVMLLCCWTVQCAGSSNAVGWRKVSEHGCQEKPVGVHGSEPDRRVGAPAGGWTHSR